MYIAASTAVRDEYLMGCATVETHRPAFASSMHVCVLVRAMQRVVVNDVHA